ncbi:STE/STE7/MEK1 protein kinase [Thecamonas trahens ATCC 50062]|uniref:mitogen-activated protein kinase kinase n=1 Tax=Thecamonas trahens ATCC 50062 TaxID=461836 RepID=A0A0L0DQL7_THETB|nr:STE/STE7/MEK1 protein kinase [Thecamonas trahens ATCC 50062]KNC54584.1 STE/STE7/MEK1 protein kinase [Thecamonas trahens ATCC 50062]|eukprot:XP_013761493.1 STE/STE7/MEK1 protein kinase [Thecamonas trahens ATCC 50062]
MPAAPEDGDGNGHECTCSASEFVIDVAQSGAGQGRIMRVWGCDEKKAGESKVIWSCGADHVDWNAFAAARRFPRGFVESGRGHIHVPFQPVDDDEVVGGVIIPFVCGAKRALCRVATPPGQVAGSLCSWMITPGSGAETLVRSTSETQLDVLRHALLSVFPPESEDAREALAAVSEATSLDAALNYLMALPPLPDTEADRALTAIVLRSKGPSPRDDVAAGAESENAGDSGGDGGRPGPVTIPGSEACALEATLAASPGSPHSSPPRPPLLTVPPPPTFESLIVPEQEQLYRLSPVASGDDATLEELMQQLADGQQKSVRASSGSPHSFTEARTAKVASLEHKMAITPLAVDVKRGAAAIPVDVAAAVAQAEAGKRAGLAELAPLSDGSETGLAPLGPRARRLPVAGRAISRPGFKVPSLALVGSSSGSSGPQSVGPRAVRIDEAGSESASNEPPRRTFSLQPLAVKPFEGVRAIRTDAGRERHAEPASGGLSPGLASILGKAAKTTPLADETDDDLLDLINISDDDDAALFEASDTGTLSGALMSGGSGRSSELVSSRGTLEDVENGLRMTPFGFSMLSESCGHTEAMFSPRVTPRLLERFEAKWGQLSERPVAQGLGSGASNGEGGVSGGGKATAGGVRGVAFNELEILGKLGKGASGTVFKVRHIPSGELMAEKTIPLATNPDIRKRIARELRVLARCDSPFIVQFKGAFFSEGSIKVCMQYMDRGSLRDLYAAVGSVPEPALAAFALSITEGLHYLKTRLNVMHRDVKPENVLVNSAGEVKLCDFGVCVNLVNSLASSVIGTQLYFAPERLSHTSEGPAPYTVQADVWCMGLLLAEVALGEFPYPPREHGPDWTPPTVGAPPPSLSIMELLYFFLNADSPSLPSPAYSEQARSFINACLMKDGKARPTPSELLKHPFIAANAFPDFHLGEWLSKVYDGDSASA